MKWHVAMSLALGLLVALPFSVAQEPEKSTEAEQKPGDTPPDESLPRSITEPDIKPTSKASGLIYVKPGTGRSGANPAPLHALLQNPEVQQAAIKQLELSPEVLKSVEISIVGGINIMTVVSYDQRLEAGLLLEALKDKATKKLIELNKPEELFERRFQEQRAVEQLQADWTRERQGLIILAKHNGVEVDPQVAAQRRLQLATQTQALQVELRGLEARHAVLEKQIAELAVKPQDEASKAILTELSTVVEARRRYVAHLNAQFNTGSITAEKLEPAKAELAQAEVEFARFRREAAEGSSQRATELRHRLEDTLIEKAENEAKLAELHRLNTTSVQVDAKRIEVELLEQKYRQAKQEVDELDAEIFRYTLTPPHVVLIRTK